MKLTKTAIIAVIVSLIIAGVIICWGMNVNCRSLYLPENCIGEAM